MDPFRTSVARAGASVAWLVHHADLNQSEESAFSAARRIPVANACAPQASSLSSGAMLWRGLLWLVAVLACLAGCATSGAGAGRFPIEHISVPDGADRYLTMPRPDALGGPGLERVEAEIRTALTERGARVILMEEVCK